MITAIDMIGTNLGSGTKTFNLNFCKILSEQKLNDEIYIFTNKDYYNQSRNKNSKINFLIKSNLLKNPIFKFLWMQFILPFELKNLKVKQFYSPMNYGPLFLKLFNIRLILAIHSNLPWVNFSHMPKNYFRNLLTKYLMEASIAKCDKLIVVSNHAKIEIMKFISINDDKIEVIYLGVNHLEKLNDDENLIGRFNYKNYFLSILSCVKYHNILNLLKAYKILISKYGISLNFVLVMQILDKTYFKEINRYIAKNFFRNEIKIFSNLESKYLTKLYSNSKFYIFSSYNEVFGLTSLEAMSNNCPVLISDRSALPEINSTAAEYFDPDNIDQIVEKMHRILHDRDLIFRLKQQGLNHSKKFTWQKTVNKTLKVLDLIVE